MDPTSLDPHELAWQLRKPEGHMGKELAAGMVQYNGGAIGFMLDLLKLQPNSHVLEIGFGAGEAIAEAVRVTPNGYVAGIDHSPDMLAMAKDRNHRALMQEHVELTLGEAKELPYEDESFDAVFAINVFHFWADPIPELDECIRVLKPGGRLAFFLPYPSSLLWGVEKTGIFFMREPGEIVKILSAKGLRNVESRDWQIQMEKAFAVVGVK